MNEPGVERPFFTIGHSTRSVAELVDMLSNAEVRVVVDVRTVPRSHRNPQFNRIMGSGLTIRQSVLAASGLPLTVVPPGWMIPS